MKRLKRAALIDAIKRATAGRSDASQLRRKLFKVAREADRVALGAYRVDGCGCPLVQAGLAPYKGPFLITDALPRDDRGNKFYGSHIDRELGLTMDDAAVYELED